MSICVYILKGALIGRSFTFDQPEIWIGRDPNCDIAFDVFKDDSVGRRHACIRSNGSGWDLENRHENGAWINGCLAAASSRLKSGDIVRLAPDGPEFKVVIESRQPSPSASADEQPRQTVKSASAVSKIPHSPKSDQWSRWAIGLGITGTVMAAAFWILRPSVSSSSPTRTIEQVHLEAPGAEFSDHAAPAQSDEELRTPGSFPAALSQAERGIVWIGVEIDEKLIPIYTGWVATPTRIVTTGHIVRRMHALKQDGQKVVVYCGETKSVVEEFRFHPGFDIQHLESEKNRHNNVGVLVVEMALPAHCPIAAQDELRKIAKGDRLFVSGYSITGDLEPYDRFNVALIRRIAGVLGAERTGTGSELLQLALQRSLTKIVVSDIP